MQMELLNWCVELTDKYPGINFDFTELNEYDKIDVWFIEILHNHNLQKYLHQQIGEDDFEPYDQKQILNTMRETYLYCGGLEDIHGLNYRMMKLKKMLRRELVEEDKVAKMLEESKKNKILVVTHQKVMKALIS